MTQVQPLVPDLRVIESGLFPASVQTQVEGVAVAEMTPLSEVESHLSTVTLPESTLALIARRAASRSAQTMTSGSTLPTTQHAIQPAAGQIHWINSPNAPDWPVALLIRAMSGQTASGWLLASEALYASDQDWLLQESDLQSTPDPRAAMVQLWNPLDLDRAHLGSCIGQFEDGAFRQLCVAADHVTAAPSVMPVAQRNSLGVDPKPGRFGLFTQNGISYVCGTPLDPKPSNDVRHHYRDLYRLFAQQLQQQNTTSPARALEVEAANAPFWRRRDAWRGAGIAALLMLTIALPLTFTLLPGNGGKETSETRGIGSSISNFGLSRRFTVVDVRFSRVATLSELTALLHDAQAEIIAGPTELGAYRVAVDLARNGLALDQLKNSALVLQVHPSER